MTNPWAPSGPTARGARAIAVASARWYPADRVATALIDIDRRNGTFNFLRTDYITIDTIQAIGVHAALDVTHVL